MERVYKIAQANVMPLPDSVFWYTISMALFLFAIWSAKRYIDGTKDKFDNHSDLITKMGNCIIELTTITKVHEVHIQALNKKVESHDKEFEAFRELYIVKYKDNGR